MEKIELALLMVAAMGCFLIGPVSAFTHIVGGSLGWVAPPNLTYYQDWAFPRTFGLGDRLVFPYRPGSGTVVSVNKQDFDACTQKNVIYMYFNGPTILNLTTLGDFYYYSGVGKHCEFGQKLHVKVVNAKGSSGKISPFKLVSKDTKTAAGPSSDGPAAHAPSAAKNAPFAAVPPPSSAATIQNVGMASGFLTIFFSLFI